MFMISMLYLFTYGFLYLSPAMTTQRPPSVTNVVTGAQIITTKPVTVTVSTKVLPCFEGMDTSSCPKDGCSDGFYCNGMQCVRKGECPCLVDGKIVKVT